MKVVVCSTLELCFFARNNRCEGTKKRSQNISENPCRRAGESPTTYAGALHQPRREEDDPFTCRCIVARACESSDLSTRGRRFVTVITAVFRLRSATVSRVDPAQLRMCELLLCIARCDSPRYIRMCLFTARRLRRKP